MDRVRRDSASLQVQIDETEQRLQAEKETLRILRQQQLGVDIQESKEESGESMKLVTYDQDNTEEETEVRYQTDSGSSWVVVNRRTSQGRSSPAVDQLHPEAHGKGPRKTVLEVFYRSKVSRLTNGFFYVSFSILLFFFRTVRVGYVRLWGMVVQYEMKTLIFLKDLFKISTLMLSLLAKLIC